MPAGESQSMLDGSSNQNQNADPGKNGTQGNQPSSDQSPKGNQPDWRESIPQDIRGEKSWEKYKDVGSALKSLHHLEKKMGSAINVPSDKATAEEIAAFREKLGVPKEAKDYKVDVQLPGDGKWDEAGLGAFNEMAHKLGLTPAQHKGLLEYYGGAIGKDVEARNAAYDAAEKALKEEWGANFDANKASVGGALAAYDPKGEAKAALKEAGLDNHPAILRLLHAVGSEIGEDQIVNGQKKETMTKEEAEAKIEQIKNDNSHPLNNKKDPKHKEAVKEYHELLQLSVQ